MAFKLHRASITSSGRDSKYVLNPRMKLRFLIFYRLLRSLVLRQTFVRKLKVTGEPGPLTCSLRLLYVLGIACLLAWKYINWCEGSPPHPAKKRIKLFNNADNGKKKWELYIPETLSTKAMKCWKPDSAAPSCHVPSYWLLLPGGRYFPPAGTRLGHWRVMANETRLQLPCATSQGEVLLRASVWFHHFPFPSVWDKYVPSRCRSLHLSLRRKGTLSTATARLRLFSKSLTFCSPLSMRQNLADTRTDWHKDLLLVCIQVCSVCWRLHGKAEFSQVLTTGTKWQWQGWRRTTPSTAGGLG